MNIKENIGYDKMESPIEFGDRAANGIYISGKVTGAKRVFLDERFGQKLSGKSKIVYIWQGNIDINEDGEVSLHDRYKIIIRRTRSTNSGENYYHNKPTDADRIKIYDAIKEVVEKTYKEYQVYFQAAARVEKMNELISEFNSIDYIDNNIRELKQQIENEKAKRNERHAVVNRLATEIQESRETVKNTLLSGMGGIN